ncbi:MAG: DUF4911 domain-containing protein [Candidatus Binatia bacterium]
MELPRDCYHEELGVYAFFFVLARRASVYLKVLLESYEGVGVMRSVDTEYASGKALVVVLVVPDFLAQARALLDYLSVDHEIVFSSAAPELRAELAADLLGELMD